MSRHSAAEAQPADGRTIGDILLARGFVTREKLDDALERQRNSGKPLGQILVEEGAISRLELASALAEQWSDIGSVSPDFGLGAEPSATATPLVELQELRNSRRVLEERLREFEASPATPDDDAERERLASRLAGVEAAVAGLQEHDAALEVSRLGQTVDKLSARLGEMSAALAAHVESREGDARVDDIDRRLATLGAAVETAFREMERRADESTGALSALTSELDAVPAVDLEPVDERVAALESRLGRLATQDRVDELVESLGFIQRGVAAVPDHSDELAEVRRRLDVLADDATAAGELRERAAAVEARVDELALRPVADDQLAVVVGEIAARVDEVASRPLTDDRLAASVEEIAARVDALASRPAADGETDGRVAELGLRFEQLATLVASLDERVVPDPELGGRVAELAGQVADLAARADTEPEPDPVLGGRVAELAGQVADLAARADTEPEPDPVLAARLDELASVVAELVARPDGREEARAAIDALGARLDDVAEIAGDDAAAARTLTELGARVEALEAGGSATGADVIDGLAERTARLEELEAVTGARIAELVERAETVDRLVREQAGPTEDAVAERLAAVEQGAAGLAGDVQRSGDEIEARVAALDARLDVVAALAAEAPHVQMPVSMSDALADGDAPRVGGGEEDVERLRMMVERLMHDFADHRRAVSAALSSREFTALLEELAARVDELQASGVVSAAPAGAAVAGPRSDVRMLTGRLDEVEESVRASRDGVFQRLERMMGTIDWRLQRLEHPEQADDGP